MLKFSREYPYTLIVHQDSMNPIISVVVLGGDKVGSFHSGTVVALVNTDILKLYPISHNAPTSM